MLWAIALPSHTTVQISAGIKQMMTTAKTIQAIEVHIAYSQ